MITLSIKANIPLGRRIVVVCSGSFCGILFCCPIGGWLLVEAIVVGPLAWEWRLKPDRKKRGGTCHRSRTTPQAGFHAVLYNTELRQVFPDENTLCGIQRGLLWDVCTSSSPV